MGRIQLCEKASDFDPGRKLDLVGRGTTELPSLMQDSFDSRFRAWPSRYPERARGELGRNPSADKREPIESWMPVKEAAARD